MVDGWIEWEGGFCPLGRNVWIEARLRDGDVLSGPSQDFGFGEYQESCNSNWVHGESEPNLDIIAYRIAQEPKP